MRVVATNSKGDLARKRAEADIGRFARELAANIIRVVRGAGKPDDLIRQWLNVLNVVTSYSDAMAAQGIRGASLDWSQEMASQLRLTHLQGNSPDEILRQTAIAQIMAGALQVAAARLLDQRTQDSVGRSELHLGVRALEKWENDQKKKRRTTMAEPCRSGRKEPESRKVAIPINNPWRKT